MGGQMQAASDVMWIILPLVFSNSPSRFFLFFFFWPPLQHREVSGQAPNPHYSSNQSCCSDNARSLTHEATRACPSFWQ